MTTARIGLLLAGMTFLANPVWSQTDRTGSPSLQAAAEATVIVAPDRAEIEVGVQTRAGAPEEASQRNARQLSRVIAALRATLGANATIETIAYSLRPEYEYPEEGGEPSIVGYVASNVVRVTVADLTRVDDVLDTAAESGATRIDGVRFTLSDETEAAAQERAIQQAAKQARAQAGALASALDVRLLQVLSAVESGVGQRPPGPPVPFSAAAARVATPVLPGPIEVRATVTLTLEIARDAAAPLAAVAPRQGPQ